MFGPKSLIYFIYFYIKFKKILRRMMFSRALIAWPVNETHVGQRSAPTLLYGSMYSIFFRKLWADFWFGLSINNDMAIVWQTNIKARLTPNTCNNKRTRVVMVSKRFYSFNEMMDFCVFWSERYLSIVLRHPNNRE